MCLIDFYRLKFLITLSPWIVLVCPVCCLFKTNLTVHLFRVKGIVCGHPGVPLNGAADPSKLSDYPTGTIISYSCDTGYNRSGARQIMCGEDGSWSSPAPQCLSTFEIVCDWVVSSKYMYILSPVNPWYAEFWLIYSFGQSLHKLPFHL